MTYGEESGVQGADLGNTVEMRPPQPESPYSQAMITIRGLRMNAYRSIDLENWHRRDVFNFFKTFDNPCFNISVMVPAEPIYAHAKARGESFFLLCLYAILRSANLLPQLRQRYLPEGQIVEFEKIAAMTPIMTATNLYCQAWLEYAPTFGEFKNAAAPKVETAKRTLDPSKAAHTNHGEDFIAASCLPRLHFTSITQADLWTHQATPILAWGKMQDGLIPISVKFNHAFVDGLHASQFFELVGDYFARPERLYHEAESLPPSQPQLEIPR